MNTISWRRIGVLFTSALALSSFIGGCSAAPESEPADTSSAEFSTCGVTPKVPVCNSGVHCTSSGWEFSYTKAGTSCTTSGGTGTCDGSGDCVVKTLTGTAYPAYSVLTLLYAAPGNMSEVDYGAQSTVGSETDVQNLYKAGVQITASGTIAGTGVMGSVGFAGGPVNGTSWEVSKTTSSTMSQTSQADALAHGTDTLYVWTNPELDLLQVGNGPVQTTLRGRGGASPSIIPINVNELSDQTLLPSWKQQLLTALTAADYKSMLGLDPLITGPVVLSAPQSPDPARYDYVTSLQLDGPDQPGDPITGSGISVTHESTSGSTSGYNTATTASITFQTGFNFFGLLAAGVQAGLTFEWDYQKTTQSKMGTSQTASVMLKTSTVGYHQVVFVYYDTLFNSFAFTYQGPMTETPAISGVAVTASGAPAANQPVVVSFADGTSRTVITNARGIYRIFDAPPGEATVTTQLHSERTAIVANKTVKVDVLAAEPAPSLE